MGIFDWIHKSAEADAAPNLSRRDFFARFAGGGSPEDPKDRPQVVRTFYVSSFPYYDGPVLVPMLRPDLEFNLVLDNENPMDPNGVRIVWGKDHLGNVPAEHSEHLRLLMADGTRLRCRATRIDPTAELSRLLEVEVSIEPAEAEEAPGSTEARGRAGN